MKTPNILQDKRYEKFVERYYDNLLLYVMENCQFTPTWQQVEFLDACSRPGARVAVSSGHGTGKSAVLAWILDWNMRVFPFSNAILTATNIEQARSVVWKYLDGVIETMERLYPWQKNCFIKETRRYYAAGYKDSWYVLPKTASKANPENLAGQHNDNLMIVVDEASGVPDAIHEVLRGALTGRRNRYIMTSQPTRPSGYFWEAMNQLNKGQKNGIYDALYMNSEESPIVSREFIKNALIEYGGHSSPEYQIRVLGTFPDNMSGFLIPRHWAEECTKTTVSFEGI